MRFPSVGGSYTLEQLEEMARADQKREADADAAGKSEAAKPAAAKPKKGSDK